MKIAPYLNFDGQCKEAFEFYAKGLSGNLVTLQTYGDSPMGDQVPPEWHDRVMHAHLVVGGAEMMGSDSPPGQHRPAGSTHVSIQIDDPAEADRIFAELAEGGTVTMPIAPTFWAERFGMLVDRFGIPWMVNCDSKS